MCTSFGISPADVEWAFDMALIAMCISLALFVLVGLPGLLLKGLTAFALQEDAADFRARK